MKKIGHIAVREFLSTVGTKGFIFGLLIMPALATTMGILGPRLFSQRNFKPAGQVAIVDPTGLVAPELRATLDPKALAARRERDASAALAAMPESARPVALGATAGALDMTLGQIPDFHLVERDAHADVPQAKAWLLEEHTGVDRHFALVVVHPDAVTAKKEGERYGTYDLFVPQNLDDRIETALQQNLRLAIVAARARARQLDRETIDSLSRVDRVRSMTVTTQGDRQSFPLNRVLPVAFSMLLFIGVMMGGQTLMTSTIEEKSSRVAEVLLSAVSPVELMAGKILGQMGVSLVALSLYVAMGIALLLSFALFGLVDVTLLFYLAVFFLLSYLSIGTLMAAIGAAVNEMKEAQSLMGPVMLMLIAPMALQVPISMNPNSTFSTIISFVPPVNTFTMLIRMTSSAPPPMWQVWLSIAIGMAAVCVAVWFAAKVFKVGLLMYGKPPDLATLIRWVRAA